MAWNSELEVSNEKKKKSASCNQVPFCRRKREKGFDFRGLQRVGWAARNADLIPSTPVFRLFLQRLDIFLLVQVMSCEIQSWTMWKLVRPSVEPSIVRRESEDVWVEIEVSFNPFPPSKEVATWCACYFPLFTLFGRPQCQCSGGPLGTVGSEQYKSILWERAW